MCVVRTPYLIRRRRGDKPGDLRDPGSCSGCSGGELARCPTPIYLSATSALSVSLEQTRFHLLSHASSNATPITRRLAAASSGCVSCYWYLAIPNFLFRLYAIIPQQPTRADQRFLRIGQLRLPSLSPKGDNCDYVTAPTCTPRWRLPSPTPGMAESLSTNGSSERGKMGLANAAGKEPAKLQCCCGKDDCVFLLHNCSVLESVERDVHTAARMGQVSSSRRVPRQSTTTPLSFFRLRFVFRRCDSRR